MTRDFDLHALYRAIDEERSRRNLTWRDVAREIEDRYAKVSPATIRGVADRSRVEGDGVLQMLLWLGRPPESFVVGHVGDMIPLRPARDGRVLRWDTAKIFRALDDKREERGLTWKEVAAEIGGVSHGQLRNLDRGGRTSLPDIMRVTRWLAIPASSFTKESST